MPAFQTPVTASSQKRKFDFADVDVFSKKRQAIDTGSVDGDKFWMVQWRHPQYKKHKTWDGDAVLILTGNKYTLWDSEGKPFGSGKLQGVENADSIAEGSHLVVGGKELEVDCAIKRSDFLSGTCFGRGGLSSAGSAASVSPVISKQFVPLKPKTLNTTQPTSTTLSNTGPRRQSAIELQPIDLMSSTNASKDKPRDSYWTANWRKPQQRKNKTWDDDAFIMHKGDKLTLISESGKILGTKTWDGLPLYAGYNTFIGGREVELDCQISSKELPHIIGSSLEPQFDSETEPPISQAQSSFLLQVRRENIEQPGQTSPSKTASLTNKPIPASTFYGKPAPKPKPKGPLHDPNAEGAVVMKAPTVAHIAKYNKKNHPIVPVVVDPILARRLRPHQQEGVKFLYECVMGLRKHEGQGCILADDMGMGKTLQTIALVWTLLKQNPYSGIGPVVGKVLIVCPVTLLNNWRNEFHKWLGKDRVGVFVGDKDKAAIKQFLNSRIHQVLVIGYERLRTVIEELRYCYPPIGLIICDEGHRLKSANNKTTAMFTALSTERRVILSGTPIQNDLSEFHAMANFCNPRLLDDYNTFRRVYETPILKSRAPGCTAKETEVGEARSAQLSEIAKSFVLRRDAGILKGYLPPKHEYVVFIAPTRLQSSMFKTILAADKLDHLVRDSTAESLALINIFTKISNSPVLLKATVDLAKGKAKDDDGSNLIKRHAVDEALKLLPERVRPEDVSLSGKLSALANLLKLLKKTTEEKCIIVSHYTSTLNIIELFCKKKGYTYHRLDGSTPAAKRQDFVNDFNRSSQSKYFVFLLSSKAGGVGLNLIGASRLCLIDSDWNPSHDLQSMARIHRDGQKRPVFIYRFLTAGTIDEKIYQRQITKLGLSNSLMGDGPSSSKSDSFTRKDLRDIFTIHDNTPCHTHDLLECPCDNSGSMDVDAIEANDSTEDDVADEDDVPVGFTVASQVNPEQIAKVDKAYMKQKRAQLAALGEWKHINCLKSNARDQIHDEILQKLLYVWEIDKTEAPAAPQSRIDSLLAAVDLENVMAEEPPALTMNDVPGGTISFLFERGSAEPELDDEDEDEEG